VVLACYAAFKYLFFLKLSIFTPTYLFNKKEAITLPKKTGIDEFEFVKPKL
jgi:hypothetical protein